MTIKELIYERQDEVYKKELNPERATELLRELSALSGNVHIEIRQTSYEYSKILQRERKNNDSAVDAKIAAECSQEWLDKKEAEDLGKLVKELIASLKYMLKNLQDERRYSGNL